LRGDKAGRAVIAARLWLALSYLGRRRPTRPRQRNARGRRSDAPTEQAGTVRAVEPVLGKRGLRSVVQLWREEADFLRLTGQVRGGSDRVRGGRA
jgi:hypothetical protein